jgi:DNA-binding PadR family transcriptional regulator
MDDKLLIRMTLRLMSEPRSATLESVLNELEPWTTAMGGARAFQTARGLGWIEAEPGSGGDCDPRYRLTQAGQNELARGTVRSVDIVAGAVDRELRRSQAVSIQSVLDVFADFDQFGGASIELVAWELDVDQGRISGAWTHAINDGLLERSGSDSTAGRNEELWSLTDRGRQVQVTSEEQLSASRQRTAS